MNAKKAKKLRWYARAQEAIMPAPVVNKEGVPSTLLVYNHPKIWKDRDGNEHTFVNRTVQYNPRTSGKGFYKALKGAGANIKGTLPYVRFMCQQRIIQCLAAKHAREIGAANSAGGPALALGGPPAGTARADEPVG